MTNLAIHDLGYDRELDSTAARELRGGMNLGFLSGLFAGVDSPILPFVQNYHIEIDYDETVIQLAPVNFTNYADNGSIASTGPVNITNVIGSSSLTLLQGAT